MARYVAHYTAVGDEPAAHWFVRRAMTYTAIGGVVLTGALLAVAWPLREALGIASISAVGLTALTAFPAATSPITWGLAQGLQRFKLIAVTYTSGAVARVGLAVLAFGIGLKVGGAVLATLVAMLVALAVPLWVLRRWFRPAASSARRVTRSEAARSLSPVLLGPARDMALTKDVDVVVAKLALTGHEAGIYGSASLVGASFCISLRRSSLSCSHASLRARPTRSRRRTFSPERRRHGHVLHNRDCHLYATAGSLIVRSPSGSGYAGTPPASSGSSEWR